VYRQFTRVGAEKVPDAKTLGKLAAALARLRGFGLDFDPGRAGR
jgi:hypothetical protein